MSLPLLSYVTASMGIGLAGLIYTVSYLRKRTLRRPDKLNKHLAPLENEYERLYGREPRRPALRSLDDLYKYEDCLRKAIEKEELAKL